jgi:hypothetical protein
MNWTEGPATWKQLRFLEQHGCKLDHRLSKAEAADLVRKFGGDPEGTAEPTACGPRDEERGISPYDFHQAVERASSGLNAAEAEGKQLQTKTVLNLALARRQDFWADTCRDVGEMQLHTRPVIDLYHKYGCLAYPPSRVQVQEILDALDSALPLWDRDHPELFYETMSLNFPELVRRR